MRISDWSSDVCSSDLFDVLARRSDANGARDVTLPYFATVVRGGTAVVSKRVGQVNIHFADGEYRASASGTAQSYVDRGQATLPADIQERIRSEEHTSELQSLMRISYAVFCLQKKTYIQYKNPQITI